MATADMLLVKMLRTAPTGPERTQLVKLLEELLLGGGSSKVTNLHVAGQSMVIRVGRNLPQALRQRLYIPSKIWPVRGLFSLVGLCDPCRADGV